MNRSMIGFAGVFCLLLGVFTPVMSMPIVGTVNYFNNGKGDGLWIALFAIASLIIILTKKFKLLFLTAIPSLIVMMITIIGFQMKMAELKNEMEKKLAGNPFGGIANLAFQNVQLQWGWVILITGAVLLIAAGSMKEEKTASAVVNQDSEAA